MAVVFYDGEWGELLPTQECFYCFQSLDEVAIWWRGASDIWIHAACFIELAVRMFRDVHEIEIQHYVRTGELGGFQWINFGKT
jgi:hypothetical protein